MEKFLNSSIQSLHNFACKVNNFAIKNITFGENFNIMIQRIQSLFLLISAILLLILLWAPLAILQIDENTFYEIYTKGYVFEDEVQYSYSLWIFNAITILIAIVTIFCTKIEFYRCEYVYTILYCCLVYRELLLIMFMQQPQILKQKFFFNMLLFCPL